MRRGQWAARAAVVVAALVAVLAATSRPVQAQEADTVLIAVITIDPDGYVILRNRLDRLAYDQHLAAVSVSIDTGERTEHRGREVMVVSVHYFGLCTVWGALEWGRVSCATIPKGEERVAGYGRRPEQQRKIHAVGFHWDGRSTDYEDGLWCTEVVAARGRRWDCYEEQFPGYPVAAGRQPEARGELMAMTARGEGGGWCPTPRPRSEASPQAVPILISRRKTVTRSCLTMEP